MYEKVGILLFPFVLVFKSLIHVVLDQGTHKTGQRAYKALWFLVEETEWLLQQRVAWGLNMK